MLRPLRAVAAAAMLASLVAMTRAPASRPAATITLEAERGTFAGLTAATTRAGYGGEGYVSGFTGAGPTLDLGVDVPRPGVYDLAIRYASDAPKGYALTVNGVGHDGFLPASPTTFATYDAGKIELAKGANRLSIGSGWGHYDLDALRLTPSAPHPRPRAVPATPSNAGASPEARRLLKRLADGYGRTTLSGLISREDVAHVRGLTGRTPAILAGDLMDYSPSRRARGADGAGETERLIAAARAGQVVTLSWHWNAPRDLIDQKSHVDKNGNAVDASWYRGFYSNATTFDFAAALDDPNGEAYRLMIADVDAIAVELLKLKAARVPVLWRPLHESDGEWFWWGTRGPRRFNDLWRLVYDRLTVHHKLDNLLWVYTWNDPAWYPGDDVVDVVGIDAYPSLVSDPLSAKWREAIAAFDGRKPVALSEFGGVPDVERMQRLGVWWCYFASWSGELGPRKNAPADLVRIFRSPGVTNLDAR